VKEEGAEGSIVQEIAGRSSHMMLYRTGDVNHGAERKRMGVKGGKKRGKGGGAGGRKRRGRGRGRGRGR
jgi:hypothetical protein